MTRLKLIPTKVYHFIIPKCSENSPQIHAAANNTSVEQPRWLDSNK